MARRSKAENLHAEVHTGASTKHLDERGWEVPDPTPVALPAGFKRPETLAEQVQRLVRTSISREAELSGQETFEEAEDFEVDDDADDYNTPYETFFDPVLGKDLSPSEFRQHEQRYRQDYLSAQRRYFEHMDRQRAVERGSAEGVSPSASHVRRTADTTSERRRDVKKPQPRSTPAKPLETPPDQAET